MSAVRDSSAVRDPSALRGLWRRSMIEWPDGRRDTSSRVHWLQGMRAYADLRQPADAGPAVPARCRDELSIEDCLRLARQEGFAGQLRFDGAHFEWIRSIDFQPRADHADAGSLSWQGDVLVERGRDIGYLEHWHRDASRATQPLCALPLSAIDAATPAVLLRLGPDFMFARDRAVVPSAHRTLSECVLQASTLLQAQQLVDCEISSGTVTADGFRILASSLPYRVGDLIAPRLDGEALSMQDRAGDGRHIRRRWRITASEGELEALAVRRAATGGAT